MGKLNAKVAPAIGGNAASASGPQILRDGGKTAVPQQRNFWIPVICGAVILTIGIGARQSFGIFQKPIAADLQVGREVWSFANALALLLMGACSPYAGNLADRFGPARTVGAGSALYVARHAHDCNSNRGNHVDRR
jgi:hypothetical protein